MAGALDAKSRETARKLLVKFGKTGTYTNTVVGVYDPTTGLVSADTETIVSITAYIDKASQGEIESGLVLASDTVVLVSAKELGLSPIAGDTITFTEGVFQVKSDLPIWSGNLIALHRLVCLNN